MNEVMKNVSTMGGDLMLTKLQANIHISKHIKLIDLIL